jgi:hypothetical protein
MTIRIRNTSYSHHREMPNQARDTKCPIGEAVQASLRDAEIIAMPSVD